MAQASKKINGGKPLSDVDIKHILLDRGETKVSLARLASAELGRTVTPWQMKAVIFRYPGVVYQDLREWLAGWIGCEVSQVGREPLPRKAPVTETAEAA
jgi:hypothetical protein